MAPEKPEMTWFGDDKNSVSSIMLSWKYMAVGLHDEIKINSMCCSEQIWHVVVLIYVTWVESASEF